MNATTIRRLGPADRDLVLAAGALFDAPPTPVATERFLRRQGHHLLMAFAGEAAVGFVTGIEVDHPDKGVELLLYELGVDEAHRRRGIGRALVSELADLARDLGCHGMWVAVEPDDAPALATYRSAGAASVGEPAAICAWAFAAETEHRP